MTFPDLSAKGAPPRLCQALESAANIQSELKNYTEARVLLTRVMEVKIRRDGHKHKDLAPVFNELARLSFFLKDFDKAESYSKSYIEVLTKAFGADHPNVGAAHHNLALVFHKQKKHKSAEGSYTQAMTICQKALGMNHPATVRVLKDYAILLKETHRDDEAEHFLSCVQGLTSGAWKTVQLPEGGGLGAGSS
jgi:tetratricopeptide (TPR) repeat protein